MADDKGRHYKTTVVDSASNSAFVFDTSASLATADLLTIKNGGTSVLTFDAGGMSITDVDAAQVMSFASVYQTNSTFAVQCPDVFTTYGVSIEASVALASNTLYSYTAGPVNAGLVIKSDGV